MRLFFFFTFFGIAGLFLSMQTDGKKHNITDVQFNSCDSVKIDGKLWSPESVTNDKIVIAVSPCLVTKFKPESDSKNLRFDLMLRDKLLEKGIFYFEFTGRKDSVLKFDRRYPVSTMFTKAQDLEAAIAYIQTNDDLKNMKIVLVGQSEGGATSAIVASRNTKIYAIVLISAPGVRGHEFMNYQSKCKDTLFMSTFGSHIEVFNILNTMSSLNKKKYEQSISEFERYRQETEGPFLNYIDNYEDYDTIAKKIMSYLQDKWEREDDITKILHKDFAGYCMANHHFVFIQPEQIALWKWRPSIYFPKIKCSVAAVYGTLDRNVEYSSSIKNIRELLAKGGNDNFTAFIIKDHDHILENKRSKPSIQGRSVDQVVDWIIRQ